MNRKGVEYLKGSELRILGVLSRHRRGLTWSELLRETGLSKSTLYEALKRLREMKLVSKAIRSDDKDRVVYRAEVSRGAAETLELIEEFVDYMAIARALESLDRLEVLYAILEVFEAVAVAFFTELEVEALDARDEEDFEKRARRAGRRVLEATSKVVREILDVMLKDADKAFNALRKAIED